MERGSDDCGVRKAMKLVGSKWKMMLLYDLSKGTKRYGELKKSVSNISEKMLVQELKSLTKSELISKKAYPEIPPRVEYTLTEKGRKALPLIDGLVQFGLEHL